MPRASLKQRPDGRYKCKYKNQCFYGPTQTEAYKKRDQYKRDLENGLRAKESGLTVSEYANRWIVVHKAEVSLKTYNAHARYLNFLCREIGDKRMRDVVLSDIQAIYNSRIGYSKYEIAHFTQTIRAIFRTALIDHVILDDPTRAAKVPKGYAGTHRALESWERDVVYQMYAGGHRLGLACMVMLYAGLRRGEVLALDIDRDVDFEARLIHVRYAVHYNSNQPILGSPKTEAGERDVPLVDILANALRGKHGLIAKGSSDTLMTQTTFSRAWENYITQAEARLNGVKQKRWYGKTREQRALPNLPPWKEFNIRTHDFRHSYCTMLYEFGIDIKSAQKWMGHADESMTRQIYTHLSEKQEQEAIRKLTEGMAMNGGQNGGQSLLWHA